MNDDGGSMNIDHIEALLAKATKGEWYRVTEGHASVSDAATSSACAVLLGDSTDMTWINCGTKRIGLIGNGLKQVVHGDLIVALVNAADELLAAARERDRLREALCKIAALEAVAVRFASGYEEGVAQGHDNAATIAHDALNPEPKP